jgi:hypothetical protein
LSFSPVSGFSFTFSDATVGHTYRIQTTPSLTVGPWIDLTNFNYTMPVDITVPPAGLATNQFLRAVTP